MTDWQELESRYFFSVYKRLPLTLVRGQGVSVWDEHGKRYLDFLAGIATLSLGHCHPVVVSALTEQASTLIHVSGWVYSIPQIRLAQLLVENSSMDKVFFANSGGEAVEGAIKLARKWGREKRDGAYKVICAQGAFHGRTLATLTAGGNEKHKLPYPPLPEGFVHVPFDNVDAIRRATDAKTAAVMLEPIQGEGGVNVPHDDYLREVRAWCDEAGILLILDEVQTGIGRLGALFGHQVFGVEPDIMTLAKGIGSGVPIGVLLSKEHCAVFTPGDHGSTYGGQPLATHVAYSVLKYIIDNDISGQVATKGKYLQGRLRGLADRHPLVTEVRGRGLLWAIELDGELAETALRACLEKGLILNAVKPTALRLMPPLVVGQEDLDRAVDIIDEVLGKIEEDRP
jgi:predicted acetylornithine/succinylornithine family transaminase